MKRTIDGILGLAIGDALGVYNEFKTREDCMKEFITEMKGFGSHSVPAGTWSDDTSMTLASIDSIINTQKINVNDMADRFCAWCNNAEYTATDELFDIGIATRKALMNYQNKKENYSNVLASNCGGNSYYDNGNGSLMRILPICYYAYYKNLSSEELLEVVRMVSSITHAHEISIMGCYIYCLYGINLLKGIDKKEALEKVKKEDYSMFEDDTVKLYERILKNNINEYDLSTIKSSGFVVSSLEAALWCFLNNENYNDTITQAINLGDDTDTIGAIAGGIAGIYYGASSIKETWKNDLIRIDYIYDLCDKFDVALK